VGDPFEVKVISLDDGKISLSIKTIERRSMVLYYCKQVHWRRCDSRRWLSDSFLMESFMRIYDDINGLIHITEITDHPIYNPAEALKLGEVVKAKVIVFDPRNRKIGLSVRALVCEEKGIPYEISKTALALKGPNTNNYQRRNNNEEREPRETTPTAPEATESKEEITAE
jgi:predicted RNA-binding protein with RPS1 domain